MIQDPEHTLIQAPDPSSATPENQPFTNFLGEASADRSVAVGSGASHGASQGKSTSKTTPHDPETRKIGELRSCGYTPVASGMWSAGKL